MQGFFFQLFKSGASKSFSDMKDRSIKTNYRDVLETFEVFQSFLCASVTFPILNNKFTIDLIFEIISKFIKCVFQL